MSGFKTSRAQNLKLNLESYNTENNYLNLKTDLFENDLKSLNIFKENTCYNLENFS